MVSFPPNPCLAYQAGADSASLLIIRFIPASLIRRAQPNGRGLRFLEIKNPRCKGRGLSRGTTFFVRRVGGPLNLGLIYGKHPFGSSSPPWRGFFRKLRSDCSFKAFQYFGNILRPFLTHKGRNFKFILFFSFRCRLFRA